MLDAVAAEAAKPKEHRRTAVARAVLASFREIIRALQLDEPMVPFHLRIAR
jgi:hypothetical protein